MKRITQSLLTQYRREISTASAVFACLLIGGKLAPIGTHDVVVAAREIPVGASVSADDLATVKSRSWPLEVRNPDDLIGKVVNHSIPTGGLITQADIVGENSLPTGLVQLVVELSQAQLRILSSGMHVDIYSAGGLVASNAVIVSVSQNSSEGFLASSAQSSAVVAVSPVDVLLLAQAKESSTLTLAIRSAN
jgi:Flp pilus assembly protein CpaB